MENHTRQGIGSTQSRVETLFGAAKAPVPTLAALRFATRRDDDVEPKGGNDAPAQLQEDISPHHRAFFQSAPWEHSWVRGGLND